MRFDEGTAARRRESLRGVRGGVDGEDPDRLFATAAWNVLTEPGDRVARRLIAEHGAAVALRALISGGIESLATEIPSAELVAGIKRWSPRMLPGVVASALDSAARSDVRLITPEDPEWPEALEDLGDHAPLCLWVRGDIAALRRDGPGYW